MTVWIVGPIAWDTVVYTDQWLTRGGFTQGQRFIERPGGTAANVARALSTASVETGFVGYLGNDEHARLLDQEVENSQIAKLALTRIDGPTSHVLILVDDSGERTIVGLAPDYLDEVSLMDVDLQEGDTVVFVLWRDHFYADLELARAAGCKLVVGLDAVADKRVSGVELAIGSHNDLSSGIEPAALLNRFGSIVVTRGAEGATEYSSESETHQPAVATEVVDTTGAGDAFLAGYLAAMTHSGSTAQQRLELGARWAAKTVATEASVPPPFSSL